MSRDRVLIAFTGYLKQKLRKSAFVGSLPERDFHFINWGKFSVCLNNFSFGPHQHENVNNIAGEEYQFLSVDLMRSISIEIAIFYFADLLFYFPHFKANLLADLVSGIIMQSQVIVFHFLTQIVDKFGQGFILRVQAVVLYHKYTQTRDKSNSLCDNF